MLLFAEIKSPENENYRKYIVWFATTCICHCVILHSFHKSNIFLETSMIKVIIRQENILK